MLQKERKYGFRQRMLTYHQKRIRNFDLIVSENEFAFENGVMITIEDNAWDSIVVETAAWDFVDYLYKSMEISATVGRKEGTIKVRIADESVDMTDADSTKGFRIDVDERGIIINGYDERGCAQGLYYLEKCMTTRRAPFITYGTVRKKPLFSPQMVHSGYGLDNYPNEHLAQIAHDGRDAILLFVKDVDITPYGYQDFNELIYRASRYGIDVYAYSYIKISKHPEEEGGPEHYEDTYGRLFRECPGFKGIVLVEGSLDFPSKDSKAGHEDYSSIPKGKISPMEFPCCDMTLFLNTIKNTIRKYRSDAELVVWTYTAQRHGVESRHKWILQIPKDVIVLITYDKNGYYTNKGGVSCYSIDYTLSSPYPSEKFITDIQFAHEQGYKIYAMTNTGGLTWDMGVMPYQPGAQLWMKRYDKLIECAKKYGISGIMESHHYGFYPSMISKLSNEIFRDQIASPEEHLEMVIAHEFGHRDMVKIKEALQCMSDSNECYTSNGLDQCSTLRIGTAWPLNIKLELKPPTAPYAHFGNSIVAAKYETEKVWQLKHRLFSELLPEEIESWKLASQYAHKGVELLCEIEDLNENLERLILLCKYIECQCHSAVCAKRWYLKKMELDMAGREDVQRIVKEMRTLAAEEIKNAEVAMECTEYDSRLGWEPSMEYIADTEHLKWKISQVKQACESDLDEYLCAAGMESYEKKCEKSD